MSIRFVSSNFDAFDPKMRRRISADSIAQKYRFRGYTTLNEITVIEEGRSKHHRL
jgi:hypothetical protein